MKPRDRFLQWLLLAIIGIITLLAVSWMHVRVKTLEVQIAEIHTIVAVAMLNQRIVRVRA